MKALIVPPRLIPPEALVVVPLWRDLDEQPASSSAEVPAIALPPAIMRRRLHRPGRQIVPVSSISQPPISVRLRGTRGCSRRGLSGAAQSPQPTTHFLESKWRRPEPGIRPDSWFRAGSDLAPRAPAPRQSAVF